jgi:hypothetical protein
MFLNKNQNHEMRLMKTFILINENEIHQFLCPFHHFNVDAVILIFSNPMINVKHIHMTVR